ADVSVCLEPRPRLMWGIGEKLSPPLDLPPLAAVLINPGVAVATKDVFAAWTQNTAAAPPLDLAAIGAIKDRMSLVDLLAQDGNDLEQPASKLAPAIAEAIAALRALQGCRLARMSGSGATCVGIFDEAAIAQAAALALRGKYPRWWVQACQLGAAG
ncbi:MAG: 4-(cytidine 5'-diphospho)-2-C-methyl-D-erythritol kinase, partial [Xanthobacteraceae bacterium]